MRTNSYQYHVARRDLLAFGSTEPNAVVPPLSSFSAESEDFNALLDAFTVYGEQANRDVGVALNIAHGAHPCAVTYHGTNARHLALACYGMSLDEAVKAFA